MKYKQLTLAHIFRDAKIAAAMRIIAASIILALGAKVTVPLPLIPFSMQTYAVMMIGLTMRPSEALMAVVCYLFQASIGLPVLASNLSNPLWMFGPTVGYLLGFAFMATTISKALQFFKEKTLLAMVSSIALGLLVLYTLGISFLALFVGFPKAFLVGFVPFIPGMAVKTMMAIGTIKVFNTFNR